MIEVPGAWRVDILQNLLERQGNKRFLQQGWSPRCIPHPSSNDDTWGVVKTTAIQAGWFDATQNKELPTTLSPRPAIEIRAGDLLMTCAGPRARCGVPALVRVTRPKLMMSGKMYRFRPTTELDPRFLEMWLLTPKAQGRIDAMKTDISDSGLNLTQDRFLQLPVPVPPLAEQWRIVEILEDHLSRLDAARKSLVAATQRIIAMEESWLANNLGRPTSRMTTVGAALVESRGGWSRSARHIVHDGTGVRYLKMNNITRRGEWDLRSLVHVGAHADDRAKYLVAEGDVLFNSKNSGDLIGKTAVADATVVGAVFNENIMRLRFGRDFDPRFIGLWFLAPPMRSAIRQASSASTNVSAVYKHELVKMPLWSPALETQQDLVSRFTEMRDASIRLAGAACDAEAR